MRRMQINFKLLSLTLLALILLTPLFASTKLYAQDTYNLQMVADKNTPIPGGKGNFDYFDVRFVSIGGGAVAFRGVGLDQDGIYIGARSFVGK
ncbi:MAG: hypothetical protein DHS20C13_00900 [Thermodesulfobacteriota bacterium]|nr:MAG: hypothetical protein DHS20C13_00900 [Thermodesulfobacteriota bacterium]